MTDQRKKRRFSFTPRWMWGGLCAVVVLIAGVWISIQVAGMWKAARALQQDLDAAQALMSGGGKDSVDVDAAYRLLQDTHTHLLDLQRSARLPLALAPHLGWVPRYGGDIVAAPALLDMGIYFSGAGIELAEPLLPIYRSHSGAEGQGGLLGEMLSVVAREGARFDDATNLAQQAVKARQRIDSARLSPRLQNWIGRLDPYLPLLAPGIQGVAALPDLLGLGQERIYLVLVQNEDELRATGGFISGVVEVHVLDGKLTDLLFQDSYAVDDLKQPFADAPAPLAETMLTELLLFRDSNWSPDFPSSARSALDLYAQGQKVRADGVIALDQQAIRLLVGALSPLKIESTGQVVTGEDVIEIARQAWNPGQEPDPEWWLHRKDFMGGVLDAAVGRVQSGLTVQAVTRLAKAALEALSEKHLLLYWVSDGPSRWASEMGWDGAMARTEGDYLMVVDTNMGFNKVNPLIEQEIEYRVDLSQPEQALATLTVHHVHTLNRSGIPCQHASFYSPTYEEMMERCYWDYLRVFVPADSTLLGATPHEVPASSLLSGKQSPAAVTIGPLEGGYPSFGTLLLLAPMESLDTSFQYRLPGAVVQSVGKGSVYHLVIQKQPGTRSIPCQVHVSLPPEAEVTEVWPEPSSGVGTASFSLILDRDQTIHIAWQPQPARR